MGALDPSTRGVAGSERLGLLVLARALQRLEVLARLQPDDARLALGPRAARAQWARSAVPAREARLEHHTGLGMGARQPGDALLARRAGDRLALPVHPKLGLGQPALDPRLPARVVGNRADDRDVVPLLAVHQYARVRVSLVHQVLRRQQ